MVLRESDDDDDGGVKRDGRRELRSEELDEKGEEAMILCVRSARFGGARGPPGTDGVFEMKTGRGAALAGGFLTSRVLVDEDELDVKDIGFGRSLLLTLALRPSDAKKLPVLDEVGLVASVRMEGRGRGTANERGDRAGYGRAGTAGTRSPGLVDKSVAIIASGRVGNVASEFIEDRETCRPWGTNCFVEGIKVVRLPDPFEPDENTMSAPHVDGEGERTSESCLQNPLAQPAIVHV